MAIKKYYPEADNTISDAFRSNMKDRGSKGNAGESDILEIFSIFAQATSGSVERSRVLLKFPIDDIITDRSAGNIPVKDKVNFYLTLHNARHSQSAPKNFSVVTKPVARKWDEGHGLDMEELMDEEPSNWLSASADKEAQISKIFLTSNTASDYQNGYITIYNGLEKRYNFWFKQNAADTAPVLTGQEVKVDIIGNTSIAENLTDLRDSINGVDNDYPYGFKATLNDSESLTVENLLKGATDSITSSGIDSVSKVETTVTGSNASAWTHAGGDFHDGSYIKYEDGSNNSLIPVYSTHITGSTSNIDIDITKAVEEWIVGESDGATFAAATAEIRFGSGNNRPAVGTSITLRNLTNESIEYSFADAGTNGQNVSGKTTVIRGNADNADGITLTVNNLIKAINGSGGHKGTITAALKDTTTDTLSLTQAEKGYAGNTKITSNGTLNLVTSPSYFTSGVGSKNYGIGVMLSGSFEDGTQRRSYYTKKFFARGSEFFLKRPTLSARWDSSITDDRKRCYLSSSLLPAADNLNKVYLYNYVRGQLKNIPYLGGPNGDDGTLILRLYPSLGKPTGDQRADRFQHAKRMPVGGGVSLNNVTEITASYVSPGIYSAVFAYTGSETFLYDVWSTGSSKESTEAGFAERRSSYVEFATGSGINIYTHSMSDYNKNIRILSKITNLKQSYTQTEQPRLRIYTRDKNSSPNIFNVATADAPVTTVHEGYYSVKRKSDNYPVIPFTTGSIKYSKLSYDSSGSFFDLDMAQFAPGYAYEISLLYRLNGIYQEQEEKFKFRVD